VTEAAVSREYPCRPIVGVGVVVWHGDRVLLVRRGNSPRRGHWSLPGGAQQLGETVAETARREVKEEVGLDVDLGNIVATVDLIERDPQDRIRYHYTLIDFVGEAPDVALHPGSDAADARWFSIAEVEGLGLWSETVRVIKLARERRSCR
jgi:ADP-ribose pyrophosphatase YjhB (NUDIX family)